MKNSDLPSLKKTTSDNTSTQSVYSHFPKHPLEPCSRNKGG